MSAHGPTTSFAEQKGSSVRYTLAVILMVVGVVVGGLGVLQKTVWAPSDTITATAQIDAGVPAVIIDPGMLNLYDTPATLNATGTGDLTIAQAPIESIDAWVGESSAQRVTGLSQEGALALKPKDGDPQVPNPSGADLWDNELLGTDTVSLDWKGEANRTGFLIAGSGQAGEVKTVTISWPNHAETPWAIPLMIIGGALIAGGVVLLFIGRGNAKREADRHKARQERRRKLAEYGTAFAIVPVLALSACGTEELPKPEPSAAPSTAMAAVSDDQAKRVLDATAEEVKAADADADAGKLATRVTGPALTQREDIYKVKKKVKKQEMPPAVANESISLNYTAATDTWPRITSMVATSGDDTQLLVFTQESPRDNYKLWSQTQLIPGVELPEFPDARQGSQLLAPEAEGYAQTPKSVIDGFAKALQAGEKSKEASNFEANDFAKSVWKNQKDLKKSVESGKAKVKYAFSPGKEIVAQDTANSEFAVVTGIVTSTTTITPDSSGGQSGTLTLKSPQKELVGSDSAKKPIETTTNQVLTFLVPKDGKAQLIGGLETLGGAKLK